MEKVKYPTGIFYFVLGILLWLDEGLNVIFIGFLRCVFYYLHGIFRFAISLPPAAGNAHYTVSQTLAEMRERGSAIGCIGCKILTWIQDNCFHASGDHCREAMKGAPEDEGMYG